MLKWLKKLKLIVAGYDADLRNAHARIATLEALVRDHTNIAVDVGFRDANHVIVVGRYKNSDYVQSFSLPEQEMRPLIDRLRDMSKYGRVARVDAPPVFRAAFKRDGGGYEF